MYTFNYRSAKQERQGIWSITSDSAMNIFYLERDGDNSELRRFWRNPEDPDDYEGTYCSPLSNNLF